MGGVIPRVWPPEAPQHLAVPEQSVAMNLVQTAAKFPERTAIIFQGRRLSYAQLEDQVTRLAGYLQNCAGVNRGDRVLLYMQNSPQFVIGYYAILRADAVVVPVNPMSRHFELEHLAKDTGARLTLCGTELLPFITPLLDAGQMELVIAANYADMANPDYDLPLPAPLDTTSEALCDGKTVLPWSHALAADEMPGPIQAGPEDLAIIPYSSGTTGQPKGCMHTHRSLMVTLVGGVVWNPADETSVSLATLPFFHVTGMQAVMNGPIWLGSCIVILARWNRKHAAELIKRYRVTRWRSIATMAIDLVNDPDVASYDLSSLEAIGGGGAAMPEAVAAKLKALTGLDYIEGYGLSETMAATHINPVQAPRRQCLGIPVFDVDARILALDDDRELGPNEAGEIIIHAPQVFRGYWNNPDATRKAFIQLDGKDFLRTGDIAYHDEDGYFFMVDRVKRMINAAGFKVWPAEVETLMHAHPGIAEACVIGARDARRGESVKAYVVPTQAARGQLTEEQVITWCKNEMAAYKCPSSVKFVDQLPRSGAGKVLWRELAEQDARDSAESCD